MRKLQVKDSGYYWCAVEIQGAQDKGAYLYLSVTADTPGLWVEQQEVAGVEGGHVSVPCHYNEPRSMKMWCRIEGSCVEVNSGESGRSEMTDDRSKEVFTVTVRELNMEDTGCPSDLTIILMALGMLLLVTAVATVTWKLCKRHKGVQPHTGAREDRSNELTPSENPADEVLYSSVILKNLQVRLFIISQSQLDSQ
ncbi:hypothetical protein COCON_G00020880 [Conger conger]|uniref:Ig-like domain-containing protein n=1 Tax=Conger conger TaxID=82655 RepID=A0A9Q1DWW0_CONCO|nr:hypothetical protein COCON_G00020880 [Conger conger]